MQRAHRSRRRRSRGMTLVEVLISAAILGVIFAGITAALMATQKQVGMLSFQTDAQSALRMSLSQIEQAVARAGFGMDPAYAVETAVYNSAGEYQRHRDGSGPYGSDELVVHYRDPSFEAAVETATSGQLNLRMMTPRARLPQPGERMLVLCSVGLTDPDHSAYVTVAARSGDPDELTVTLSGDGEFPFREQSVLDTPCFSDGTARAYRIERRHFFISWLFTGENTPARPALLVSRGLNGNAMPDNYGDVPMEIGNGAGARALGDAQLLAFDVEQLQVAYIMNEPGADAPPGLPGAPDEGASPTGGNWIFGDSPGTREAPSLDQEEDGLPFPLLDISRVGCIEAEKEKALNGCGYGSSRRFTGHPGNIRAVRVSLAARSPRPDHDEIIPETQLGLDNPAAGEGPMENLQTEDLPPPSRHRRVRIQTTISLKNMLQQKHFIQGNELFVAAPPSFDDDDLPSSP